MKYGIAKNQEWPNPQITFTSLSLYINDAIIHQITTILSPSRACRCTLHSELTELNKTSGFLSGSVLLASVQASFVAGIQQDSGTTLGGINSVM